MKSNLPVQVYLNDMFHLPKERQKNRHNKIRKKNKHSFGIIIWIYKFQKTVKANKKNEKISVEKRCRITTTVLILTNDKFSLSLSLPCSRVPLFVLSKYNEVHTHSATVNKKINSAALQILISAYTVSQKKTQISNSPNENGFFCILFNGKTK